MGFEQRCRARMEALRLVALAMFLANLVVALDLARMVGAW